MNNIEILEDYIDSLRNGKPFNYTNERKAQAIENLIQENKELKERINVLNQEKEYLNTIIDSDNDNYIPKSKLKEKIEELDKNLKFDDLKPPYGINEEMMWAEIIKQHNKSNELVQAVKQLDKNIKEK